VAIVTGAGRGIGREHALSLAYHGAKVVVNDLGGNIDGSGGDLSPADQVVEEIKAMGGEAVSNGDSVSSWEGAQRLVNTAIETFGDLHVVVNNAGILRDRVLVWEQPELVVRYPPSRVCVATTAGPAEQLWGDSPERDQQRALAAPKVHSQAVKFSC